MIVVDASVAVKWFVPEPDADAAERLLETSERLVAPSLILIEVRGAILRRERRNECSEDEARQALGGWTAFLRGGVVEIIPFEQLLDGATELARRLGHPVADCLYLAAAMENAAMLVTADRVLGERATAIHAATRLLGTEGRG